MTWKEFKEKVEAAGVNDDMQMSVIDIAVDYDDARLDVQIISDGSVCITDY